MTDLPVEEIAFDRINPAPYNPRVRLKPGDPEYADIAASLDEFGLVQTLVWNRRTGNLVAGHQRFYILGDRGRDRAKFTVVDLDLAAEKRLNIILNKVTGRWDRPKLETLLRDFQAERLDLSRLGFSPVELNALLGAKPKRTLRDPDNAPAASPDDLATTQAGDIFTLKVDDAEHRLMCGDSERHDDIKALLDGARPRLLFTDPPYGVSYTGTTATTSKAIENDDLREDALQSFLQRVFTAAYPLTHDKAALYCFYASRNHIQFETALTRSGWTIRQQLLWTKQLVLGRSDYHWAHEPMLYCGKTGSSVEWFGDRTQKTLFEMSEPDLQALKKDDALAMLRTLRETADIWDEKRDPPSSYIHPTQKPIALAGRAIRNSTMPGEEVLDLFGGSGSTLVAAEMHDRASMSMEKSRGHCDAIVRRFLETFEGAQATRNGEPFTLSSFASV